MKANKRARLLDILYLAMTIVPFILCMALRAMTNPASEGITVSGAHYYFIINIPFAAPAAISTLPLSESQVNSWAVIIALLGLSLYMTNGISVIPNSKRQIIA